MLKKSQPSFKEKLNQLFESLSPSVGSTVFPDPAYLDPRSLAKAQDDRIENEYSDESAKKRRAVLDPSHAFVPTDMFGTIPDTGMPSSVGVIGNTPPRSDNFVAGRHETISPSINYDANAFDSAGESEDDEDAAPLVREFDYLACVKCKMKPCSCKAAPTDESGQSTFGGYDNKLDPKGPRNKYWHQMDL